MEPKFSFSDEQEIPWITSEIAQGVEVKTLGVADEMTMELYRFSPNSIYPDHFHEGPEFVYLLEGSARQAGQWLETGWSSAAGKDTLDSAFISGEQGCLFLTVYKKSRYV
ncbi:MAG: anti-sigma factor ChrR (cupin superfamily) [Parasphingorhabdus sp.]|jgi:anti-sigma factor ChrR (cupin superfamily)